MLSESNPMTVIMANDHEVLYDLLVFDHDWTYISSNKIEYPVPKDFDATYIYVQPHSDVCVDGLSLLGPMPSGEVQMYHALSAKLRKKFWK